MSADGKSASDANIAVGGAQSRGRVVMVGKGLITLID